MKIGYIIPNCNVSGGVSVICQQANRLKMRGHDVSLLSVDKVSRMDWFPQQCVPIISVDKMVEEMDVLVATGWNTAFLLVDLPAKVKCYFVQSDETRFHPSGSRWEHLTALTYFLGYNYFTEARWIKSWLAETFGHHVELVPNGLDPDIFYPCEPLLPRGKRPRILLEGAINLPYKGMAEAFEVVGPMDVEVWCVSSYGEPRPGWRCDRFFEHVPMSEMRRIYSSCDILLKLSRVEGFFGPPMEMMACGGVSIVGKVTGYDEYIEDGINALVVDAGDVEGARSALHALINDVELYKRLVMGGKKTAQEWSWEGSIDILEKYYDHLLVHTLNSKSNSGREKFDKSIGFVYDFMSRGLLPEEITSQYSSVPVPPHAQKLAAILAAKPSFWVVSYALKQLYRGIKFFKRCIS